MTKIINKTMDRSDLLTDQAKPVVEVLNKLVTALYSKGLYMTSWYGTLPKGGTIELSRDGINTLIDRLLRRTESEAGVGIGNRGPDYEPLSNAVDDGRVPWYLYWEIVWVMKHGPEVKPNMRLLDAGGTSSLFTCYLASLGCEVHSIDINRRLVANGNRIAKAMGWNMRSYHMDVKKLDFEDESFDHAYSICVFEHLEYEARRQALSEIARCLRPNGILSLTFDYRNPAPYVAPYGPDTSEKNQLKTESDIRRNFVLADDFELLGNQGFLDNGRSYLVNYRYDNAPYTFAAIFLRKRA